MKTHIIEERERIEAIILKCKICYVGITDTKGNPYVIPMNFGYKDGIIYLHSGPEGSKLEMLAHNNQVCITFCTGHELVYQHPTMACSYSMRSESAICKGKVVFIEDDLEEKRMIMDIIMRNYTENNYKYSDPSVRHVKVWKVKIDEISGKIFGLRGLEKPE